jgi:hypothetical protein
MLGPSKDTCLIHQTAASHQSYELLHNLLSFWQTFWSIQCMYAHMHAYICRYVHTYRKWSQNNTLLFQCLRTNFIPTLFLYNKCLITLYIFPDNETTWPAGTYFMCSILYFGTWQSSDSRSSRGTVAISCFHASRVSSIRIKSDTTPGGSFRINVLPSMIKLHTYRQK